MGYAYRTEGDIATLKIGDTFTIAGNRIRLPWWSLRRWRAWWKGELLPLQVYTVTGQYTSYAAYKPSH